MAVQEFEHRGPRGDPLANRRFSEGSPGVMLMNYLKIILSEFCKSPKNSDKTTLTTSTLLALSYTGLGGRVADKQNRPEKEGFRNTNFHKQLSKYKIPPAPAEPR